MKTFCNDHRTTRISALSEAVIAILQMYRRAVSPIMPPACRYVPTCSEYAVDAIRAYGTARGTWMAVTRITRCHPGRAGGWDPVPPRAGSEEGIPDGPSDTARIRAADSRPLSISVSGP